jgi:hypothetical protein
VARKDIGTGGTGRPIERHLCLPRTVRTRRRRRPAPATKLQHFVSPAASFSALPPCPSPPLSPRPSAWTTMDAGGGASWRLKVRQLTTGWCRDDGGGTKTTLPAMREYSFYKREQRWRRAYLRIESSTGRWPPPSANRRGCRPPRAPLGRLEAPPPRLHPPRQAEQGRKPLFGGTEPVFPVVGRASPWSSRRFAPPPASPTSPTRSR